MRLILADFAEVQKQTPQRQRIGMVAFIQRYDWKQTRRVV
jgi:hypothetical protein